MNRIEKYAPRNGLLMMMMMMLGGMCRLNELRAIEQGAAAKTQSERVLCLNDG